MSFDKLLHIKKRTNYILLLVFTLIGGTFGIISAINVDGYIEFKIDLNFSISEFQVTALNTTNFERANVTIDNDELSLMSLHVVFEQDLGQKNYSEMNKYVLNSIREGETNENDTGIVHSIYAIPDGGNPFNLRPKTFSFKLPKGNHLAFIIMRLGVADINESSPTGEYREDLYFNSVLFYGIVPDEIADLKKITSKKLIINLQALIFDIDQFDNYYNFMSRESNNTNFNYPYQMFFELEQRTQSIFELFGDG